MPLYIADYLRDTSHLRALESGAYLHLIMAYWANGKLPNDDKQLATIAKVTDREWRSIKSTLAEFFGPDWSSHKRIDKEIAHAAEVSNKRKNAVKQREIKRASNDASKDRSNDDTLHTTQSQEEIDIANGVHAEFLKVAKTDPEDPILFGSIYGIQAMLSRGFTRETILAGAANAMRGKEKPPNWNYFARCIESENEKRSAPAKKERGAFVPTKPVDPDERAIEFFKKVGRWHHAYGPEPGMPGCRASPELLAKYGYRSEAA